LNAGTTRKIVLLSDQQCRKEWGKVRIAAQGAIAGQGR